MGPISYVVVVQVYKVKYIETLRRLQWSQQNLQ